MEKIDPKFRTWIIENVTRGCTVESIIDAMAASGHARDYAQRAVAQVVAERSAGSATNTAIAGAPAGTGTWGAGATLRDHLRQGAG